MEEKELLRRLDELRETMKPQMLHFAEEYIRNNSNGGKSAIKAGYSAKTAYSQANRLLKNDKVSQFINYSKQLANIHTNLERSDIIRKLEEMVINESGNAKVKAMEMLISMNGWNAPTKSEVVHNGDMILQYERIKDMKPEEIKTELSRLRGELN